MIDDNGDTSHLDLPADCRQDRLLRS